MLFASAPKIVLFSVLFKICFSILVSFDTVWSLFIGISAVLSVIFGSVAAIYQKRVKRLFAYSTISHTGFILLAFLACSLNSAKALVFYILVYSCLTIAVFSTLINITNAFGKQPKYIINLAAIGSKNYIFALSFLAKDGSAPPVKTGSEILIGMGSVFSIKPTTGITTMK
jgi:NADH-quinone oxidoreductase subunit N